MVLLESQEFRVFQKFREIWEFGENQELLDWGKSKEQTVFRKLGSLYRETWQLYPICSLPSAGLGFSPLALIGRDLCTQQVPAISPQYSDFDCTFLGRLASAGLVVSQLPPLRSLDVALCCYHICTQQHISSDRRQPIQTQYLPVDTY